MLNYDVVGATAPSETAWNPVAPGYRPYEWSGRLGRGDELWAELTATLLTWGLKTRSGFRVEQRARGPMGDGNDSTHLVAGDDWWLIAQLGPLAIREPVRVIEVMDSPDRVGYSYGTGQGHPVSGEEAFILHRGPAVDLPAATTPAAAASADEVWLTLRSLTRAPADRWRYAFPLVLAAQRHYRRRYQRAFLQR